MITVIVPRNHSLFSNDYLQPSCPRKGDREPQSQVVVLAVEGSGNRARSRVGAGGVEVIF